MYCSFDFTFLYTNVSIDTEIEKALILKVRSNTMKNFKDVMKGLNYTSIFAELNKTVFFVFSFFCSLQGVVNYIVFFYEGSGSAENKILSLYITMSGFILISLSCTAILKFGLKLNSKFSTLFVFFFTFCYIWFFCYEFRFEPTIIRVIAAFLVVHLFLNKSKLKNFFEKGFRKKKGEML